jgi:hypothetical protein
MALTWAVALPAAAQSRLFSSDAPLQIVISAPFPALVSSAKTSTKPYPASLSVVDGAGAPKTLPVELRPRGHTRRTAGYCSFPPLYLKFDKAAAHGTVFQGQHKLKLVTYCRPVSDYEQRIVLEYLAYRLYNLMTPMSFRVRAADVTYQNSAGGGEPVKRFGFLVENIDDVADRNQRDHLAAKSHEISAAQLDARASARAALFEFMIGNLDWDFLAAPPGADCCHNALLVAARKATPATASGVAPVPYDFDYSGFVDSPYAGPPPSLPVTKLTERLYRGYCVSSGDIPAVVEEYRDHRAQVMALINGEPRLNDGFRNKTARFIDGFYAVLDDPQRVQKNIVGHCR